MDQGSKPIIDANDEAGCAGKRAIRRGGLCGVASGGVASGGVGSGGYRQKTHRLFMFYDAAMENHSCQVERWSVGAIAAWTPARCPKSPTAAVLTLA